MTTLREAAQAALRIIELRRNLGNAEYDKQAEQAANDLRAVLAVESVRSALAEFDASLTDPTKISVHQTATGCAVEAEVRRGCGVAEFKGGAA